MHLRIEEKILLKLKDTLIQDALSKGAKEYNIKTFIKIEEIPLLSKESMAFYESVYTGIESLKSRCNNPLYTDRFNYIFINNFYKIDESINRYNVRDYLQLTVISFFSHSRYSFYGSLTNDNNEIKTLALIDDGSPDVYFKGGFFPDDLLQKHKLPTFTSYVQLKAPRRIVFEDAVGI